MLKGAADVFGAETAEPSIGLKDLHAKIGQQLLEFVCPPRSSRSALLSAK